MRKYLYYVHEVSKFVSFVRHLMLKINLSVMIFTPFLMVSDPPYCPTSLFLTFIYHLQAENSSHSSDDWFSDFQASVARVRPSSLRGGLGVVTAQPAKLSDIRGMDNIKKSLCAAIEWPLLYPAVFAKFGLPQPKGTCLCKVFTVCV
jgi:hypothetical protein